MSEPGRAGSRFQGRGILLGNALYIERRADRELLDLLRRGEAAYVLGPRQVGKSNLRVRTERVLSAEGVRCAAVDLSGLDRPADAEAWYYGILVKIARDLGLPVPLEGWSLSAGQPAAQRFTDYLRDGVMARLQAPLVVFFDEIDATYALPFDRDTFFLALRSVYQERSRAESRHRPTFCLVGVSRPSDLIAHADQTPLGIPRVVFVEDFSLKELRAALPLLADAGSDPDRLLRAAFSWTHGHPAMSQQIFEELVGGPRTSGSEDVRVRRIVEEKYLRPSSGEDPILADVARRFARSSRTLTNVPAALSLYRRILKGDRLPPLDAPEAQTLRLVGLAAERPTEDGRRLSPRNRIFASVFDLEWIRAQEQSRPFADALHVWLDAGRDAAYLLRGKALEKARAWAAERSDLTAEERALLDDSVEAERAERHLAEQRLIDREKREQAEEQARLAAAHEKLEREQREQAEEQARLADDRAALEREQREQAEAQMRLAAAREKLEREQREQAEARARLLELRANLDREEADHRVRLTAVRWGVTGGVLIAALATGFLLHEREQTRQAQQVLDTQKQVLDTQKQAISNISRQLQAAATVVDDLSTKLDQAETKAKGAAQDVETKAKALSDAQARLKRERLNTAVAQSLQEEVSQKLDDAVASTATLHAALAQAQSTISEKNQKLDAAHAKIDSLNKELESVGLDLLDAQDRLNPRRGRGH